jgi:hypothetical protein
MKKSELKAIIKECVKETLFEEGILSGIIAEVAFGLTNAQTIMQENTTPSGPSAQTEKNLLEEQSTARSAKLTETKQRILNAIAPEGLKGVFEGTEPLRGSGAPTAANPGPCAGLAPDDAGVDISGLLGIAGNKWKTLK